MEQKAKVLLVSSLVIVDDLDPRGGSDHIAVNDYAAALALGDTFPPILVDEPTMRVIDGRQRVRAFQKAGRKKISAHLTAVVDDKDFYLKAVESNAKNGIRFSEIEKKNIRLKASQLGIEEARTLAALRLPIERIKPIPMGRFCDEPFPLKNAAAHMDGRALTDEQFEVHRSLGGQRQADIFGTAKRVIQTDLTDWKNGVVVRQLIALCNVLIRRLSEMGYGGQLVQPFRVAVPELPGSAAVESLRDEAARVVVKGAH
jgi:hypothetical protein